MANKRPGRITAICVFGLFGALFTIPMLFSNVVKQIGPWYPPYLALSFIVGSACLIGLWMMKKWGVITYTVLVGINQIVLIAMGVWNVFALIIPVIIIAIGFSKYKLME